MAAWKRFDSWWEQRKREERVLVLVALVCSLGLLWFQVAYTGLAGQHSELARRITVTNSQIAEQVQRQTALQSGAGDDPNIYALNREKELVSANNDADGRLNDLYGQLIDPREMSLMLTRILQRDTSLQLVSLENIPSVSLLSTQVSTLDGSAEKARNVEVFRHGLKLVFKGEYLETMRYLQSLEQLQSNFFWDSIEYQVNQYPEGTITLEIYTLSTEKGWIGV